jgi:hypothetical protein
MAGKPFDWNVVVAGEWNVAILTPMGIARRLFGLDPGTPVEVQVFLDRQAPIRVIYSNVMVVPSGRSLVISPIEPTAKRLGEACAVAARAIESLPETPFSAAGVNLRYQFDAMPDELLNALGSSLDDRLAEANFRTVERSLKRAVRWEQGVLNIQVQETENASGLLVLNFHRQSAEGGELREWLGQLQMMMQEANRLLASTLRVMIQKEDEDE